MGSRHIEEFTLDDAASPSGERSAGPEASGDGPAGPDRRRRGARGWWRSPGPWVAAAVVLVVVGAAVSPQGEPLEPRPPDTAWTASAAPGRAPGVWMLGDRPVVTAADGLTAYDPATGEPAWTAALEDPACTATEQVLTCVHGEGEDASIATIDAAGDVTEQPFPGADIAASVGDDVVVAGGAAVADPWFGRFTATAGSAPEPVWQYQPPQADSFDLRWHEATLSQGIVTVSTAPGEGSTPGRDYRAALAADVETGEPRPAVVVTAEGTSINMFANPDDEWEHTVLPLSGRDPRIPGHPEAVFATQGVFDSYGGARILELRGRALAAAGDDVITNRIRSEAMETPTPGAEVDVATRTERVDVRTGQTQWQWDRDQLVGCPCTTSPDTVVLTGSHVTLGERFTFTAGALLGVDLDSGRHEWTLPISTAPDAIVAGADHVYVLTGGTLTAYEST